MPLVSVASLMLNASALISLSGHFNLDLIYLVFDFSHVEKLYFSLSQKINIKLLIKPWDASKTTNSIPGRFQNYWRICQGKWTGITWIRSSRSALSSHITKPTHILEYSLSDSAGVEQMLLALIIVMVAQLVVKVVWEALART